MKKSKTPVLNTFFDSKQDMRLFYLFLVSTNTARTPSFSTSDDFSLKLWNQRQWVVCIPSMNTRALLMELQFVSPDNDEVKLSEISAISVRLCWTLTIKRKPWLWSFCHCATKPACVILALQKYLRMVVLFSNLFQPCHHNSTTSRDNFVAGAARLAFLFYKCQTEAAACLLNGWAVRYSAASSSKHGKGQRISLPLPTVSANSGNHLFSIRHFWCI